MKRLFDLCFAALLLAIMLPVLVVIALLVRLDSRGPALFRQKRVGLGGREFTVLKFRTMSVREESGSGRFDAGDTSRVTRMGRFLRATKLDELPQLWNVFKGEMSFVGPRPEVRAWVDAYSERWESIHRVKPGITDPASIAFRNEEEILADAGDPEEHYRLEILPRKLDLYDDYIKGQSLWLDIKIMLRTALAVVAGRMRDR